VPDAAGVIASLTKQRPELIIGAGTVLDVETAVRCLDAGANFLTSPGLDLDIVEFAHRRDTVVFPGALTPSEVMAARKAGCDFVKIFPCSQLGGPSYIKALKAPFPKVPLIASGGVNERNIVDFILAGAAAVGVGGHLIPRRAIELRQPHRIHELAARFVKALKAARSQVTEG
jgi:2-dehydro-3-deoxyphosphogluconate aldolase/(4S)-4-hydroxy-2-oxoglutarate aldolase